MATSVLDGKRILAVDDEPDILEIIEEEILDACKDCKLDKARTYEAAVELLDKNEYDLVILDIMGVRGFDLLKLGVRRNFPVAMLTAHALNPEALKRSIELGARAYLPKEKLGDLVPFLEDILEFEFTPGWGHLFGNLRGYFDRVWGKDWAQSETKFWDKYMDRTKDFK